MTETMAAVLPESSMWSVNSEAQAQRSPNGAGARATGFIEGVLGVHADGNASTEEGYRRIAYSLQGMHPGFEALYDICVRRSRYLTQLAQSESMRAVVDGGRLGVAASNNASGVFERPQVHKQSANVICNPFRTECL